MGAVIHVGHNYLIMCNTIKNIVAKNSIVDNIHILSEGRADEARIEKW